MSTRTIIEINHDYIARMKNNGHISEELRRALSSGEARIWLDGDNVPGMRWIGERHHSEELRVTIK